MRSLISVITLGAFATLAAPFAHFIRRRARPGVDTAQWTPELLKQIEWHDGDLSTVVASEGGEDEAPRRGFRPPDKGAASYRRAGGSSFRGSR